MLYIRSEFRVDSVLEDDAAIIEVGFLLGGGKIEVQIEAYLIMLFNMPSSIDWSSCVSQLPKLEEYWEEDHSLSWLVLPASCMETLLLFAMKD